VPDYNVAPTDPAPIVRVSTERGPMLCVARWGFLPPWARDAKEAARMINARSETVVESRAFGEAFARRRCLVPADGWYEWRVDGDADSIRGRARAQRKQPYFMTRVAATSLRQGEPSPEPVVFGGVWSRWGSGAESRITFSIITMPASGELAAVHERMPLLLERHRWAEWLRGSSMADLLTPPSSEYCAGFEIRPISTAVGDVRKDGPELVRRVAVGDPGISTVDCAPTLF